MNVIRCCFSFIFLIVLLSACAPERDFGEENEENFPPVIAASVPEYFLVNEQLVLDASNSRDSDGTIIRYLAIYGDGTTEDEESDGIFEHTYSSVGRFTITIQVFDDLGESSSRS